jgi:sugar/nucleoside kinase (ribokinase family)
MDVIGDFTSADQHDVDKVGEISHSIGGTAFNIAVGIANAGGVTVAMYTHLRAKSMVTDLILSRLHEEGVSTKYVVRDPTINKDSGFVAHRQEDLQQDIFVGQKVLPGSNSALKQ